MSHATIKHVTARVSVLNIPPLLLAELSLCNLAPTARKVATKRKMKNTKDVEM